MDLTHLSKSIVEFFEKLSSREEAVVQDTGFATAQAHTIEIIGHSRPIKMTREIVADLTDEAQQLFGTILEKM